MGIQSLARTANVLSLQVSGSGDERSVTAVLLNPAPDALEVQLLLPAGVHLPGQTYEFEGNGNAVMLMHPTLVEQGEDYELIKARQMIRDTSGE